MKSIHDVNGNRKQAFCHIPYSDRTVTENDELLASVSAMLASVEFMPAVLKRGVNTLLAFSPLFLCQPMFQGSLLRKFITLSVLVAFLLCLFTLSLADLRPVHAQNVACSGAPPTQLSVGARAAVLPIAEGIDALPSVIVAHADQISRVWEVATRREIAQLIGQFCLVGSVGFSPDDKRVLTAGHDGSARIWEVSTGKLIQKFTP